VSKIIEVRTDLPSINPHDYLDYILEYKPYLEFILYSYGGYISQGNFFHYMNETFNKTEGQTKTILQKLVKNNWIGQENIGNRFKILFLKRKARVCLHEKNLSDLPKPTNRTIIRTLLLEHYAMDKWVAEYQRDVYKVKTGFDSNDIIFAVLPLQDAVQIVFIDLTRKTAKRYAEIIKSFLDEDERFDDRNVNITFITYTEARKKTLLKVFEDSEIKNLKATHHEKERLNFEVMCYNLLPYFDGKEPLM